MYTSIHDCTTDFVGDTSPQGSEGLDQKSEARGLKAMGSAIRGKIPRSILLSAPEPYEMALNRPNTDGKHKKANKGFKVIPVFCTAHPLLRITLWHPRWRRFFPLARKEQTRAAYAELQLLFAIIMPLICWQLPGLLSKNKKMKEMCVIPNSAVVFHFAAVELWNC